MKPTNEQVEQQLRADLAARDALNGDMRDALVALNAIQRSRSDDVGDWRRVYGKVDSVLAKTPDSAGAEIARLRTLEADHKRLLKVAESASEIDRLTGMAEEEVAKRAALTAKVAELEGQRENWRVSSVAREAVARAEKSEARVSELETELRGEELLNEIGRADCESVPQALRSVHELLSRAIATLNASNTDNWKKWRRAEARGERLAAAGSVSLAMAYAQGYSRGHNDTVEARYVDVVAADHETYFADDINEEIGLGAFPQWSAALAGQPEAQAHKKEMEEMHDLVADECGDKNKLAEVLTEIAHLVAKSSASRYNGDGAVNHPYTVNADSWEGIIAAINGVDGHLIGTNPLAAMAANGGTAK